MPRCPVGIGKDRHRFEAKAPTGTDILSCGVEHTGQRHQLAKLQRITSRAGLPKAVFVFFFENDVVNEPFRPRGVRELAPRVYAASR